METVTTTEFGCHYHNPGEEQMNKPEYYVGIDVASAQFTAAVGRMEQKWKIVVPPAEFVNEYDSFGQFLHWMETHQLGPHNVIVCMEATGVYNEVFAHFLVINHYTVAIEPPLKVKRAFAPVGHKTDPVDSCQIAEYAYRYYDELSAWQPRDEVLEQIQTLLTTREQFTTQRAAHQNALKALKRKKVRTPLAEKAHQNAISELHVHIKTLEEEIERLIDQDPDFRKRVELLLSVPGVGLLLAAHLLVLMQSEVEPPDPKQLAAFIGICPYQHKSGSSINFKPTSRHYGPPALRKLIFLAACSVRTHREQFKLYFLRKIAEGKPKKLVINNIANKLLKIICAVVRSGTPFVEDFHSVNPGLLKKALTVS
jgi:transposase